MRISYIALLCIDNQQNCIVLFRENDLDEYMIYIGINIAKRKFDYCIINSDIEVLEKE